MTKSEIVEMANQAISEMTMNGLEIDEIREIMEEQMFDALGIDEEDDPELLALANEALDEAFA